MNAEGFSFRAIKMTVTSTILPSIAGVYKCTRTIRKRNVCAIQLKRDSGKTEGAEPCAGK